VNKKTVVHIAVAVFFLGIIVGASWVNLTLYVAHERSISHVNH
jgi:hypothetical protein